MEENMNCPQCEVLKSEGITNGILSRHILNCCRDKGVVNILEAGCGAQWRLNIKELNYNITGMDISEEAISQRSDLDRAIVGDLRTVLFEDGEFDIIYCSDVLEHIDGAERVLDRFAGWLKPGGVIILEIPDRNTAIGFLTRITPYWFHILYYRIQGCKNAGKSGYSPFRTYYDKVISGKGINGYCRKHGLVIQAEYKTLFAYATQAKKYLYLLVTALLKVIHIISFGRLSAAHAGLIYIITKP
jgi:SAM-dependent methyltransferase